MAYRILTTTPDSVTFEVDAQRYKAGRFTIPVKVRQQLGVGHGEEVRLRIESLDYQQRWAGTHRMRSGAEIYGPEFVNHVGAGERIRVEASRA